MGEQPDSDVMEPPGYVGASDHGPVNVPGRDEQRLRAIASTVWGGVAAEVTSEHGGACDYCSDEWPTAVCMPAFTHPGVDISLVRGTDLYAAADGVVEFAGWANYYRPHHVDIRTVSGDLHIYGHMWSVDPAIISGARVRRGQRLGTSGEQTIRGTMVPDGTGAHLHFETRSAHGCGIDPEPALVSGTEIPASTFRVNDRITVIDGPLHLRSAPGLSAAVLADLPVGTDLCVAGDSRTEDGYRWVAFRQNGGHGNGWVAARFCALREAQGCAR